MKWQLAAACLIFLRHLRPHTHTDMTSSADRQLISRRLISQARWNREIWHHETWQRGTRSNGDVRVRLNRGGPEQSSVQTTGRKRRYATPSNIRRRVTHFIRHRSRTASFVRRLGSSHVQTTSWRTPGADNVFRWSRLYSKQQSLPTARGQWFLPRGLLTLETTDVRLSWRHNGQLELLPSPTQLQCDVMLTRQYSRAS